MSNEKQLTIIEHIDELRKRLMVIVVFFVIALVGGFFIAKPLIHYLQYTEEAKSLTLNAFNVTDPILIYLKVIVIVSFILISPVLSYQLWSFVSPGLHETERKVTLSYIPFGFLLFLGGISFSYYILFPYIMKFTMALANELEITQTLGINEYFNFLIQITIPFGLIFQMPILTLFLTRLGILNPSILVKVRKYAFFVLFIIAAIITPPDLFSHLFVTVPLFLLYEISILISRMGYRKYLKAEQQRQIEEMNE
ncbi:twin-arginine translocase subunit TatC [Sporosarcina pasteurii]|uniref:Sec-independent protein translocase protein TatC n=1 Tax=Sporosarcina pasteurii TaxID=1474 RepID=A0A380CI74_SPOPA|nr:twin-arginine translocase subunit TatC [Sporosarcina pasteurii]MDS9473173.1 twin-arginine translocase subunit TatC [Sporosarcina pasteurii]QBQ06908.1 twin-arginine translocase subunit TatC [Sporosarcina pasteurii]SUJ19670.1 Sec-independent protein translocase protein TatCy [Sporosarcina pasteurii]